MEFIAAKCPNCAGDLRLPDDKKQVKCMYCGVDVLVQPAIKAAQANANSLLKLAKAAANAGNNGEAYEYFTRVLELEPENYLALLGKADAAGRLSTVDTFRNDELLQGVAAAVDSAPSNLKDSVNKTAATTILDVSKDYSSSLPYFQLSSTEQDNVTLKRSSVIDCLRTAHEYDPTNADILVELVSECRAAALNWKQVIVKHKLELLQMGVSPDENEPSSLEQFVTQYETESEQWMDKLETLSPERHAEISAMHRAVDDEIEKSNAEIAKASGSGCATLLTVLISTVAVSLIIILSLL